jgi:cytochrome c oxidase subunit 2
MAISTQPNSPEEGKPGGNVAFASQPKPASQLRAPRDSRGSSRSNLLAALVIGVLAVVLGFVVGRLNPLLTGATSVEGDQVDALFGVLLGIGTAVFVVVQGGLIYSIIRFRAREGDDDAPAVHGNVGLEILWTAVPAAIVTGLALYSYATLASIEAPAPDAITVQVTGRQFAWDFYYPDRNVHSPDLHVPLGLQAHLVMKSDDVIHSFWVPDFRLKKDVMPDRLTELRFTPDKAGSYPVVCSRLCGAGHAYMRANVIVQPENEFTTWLYQQQTGATVQAGGQPASPAEAGKAVFLQNNCGACHTLKDANATGKVGPALDGIGAAAANITKDPGYHGKATDAAGYIRESIVEPNAYIVPGFSPNVMPQNFGQTIPAKDLDNLVQYLLSQK